MSKLHDYSHAIHLEIYAIEKVSSKKKKKRIAQILTIQFIFVLLKFRLKVI